MSITEVEDCNNRAALRLAYVLQRPFPDAELLLDSEEERSEYERSLAAAEARGWSIDEEYTRRSLRIGTPVSSVAELRAFVERDVAVSPRTLARHRFRLWRASYFDTVGAGWDYAQDDENVDESSKRTYISRKLWIRLAILMVAIITSVAIWAPLFWKIVVPASLLSSLGIIILAASPSYVWIGTQTIIARGLFGIRRGQQSRSVPMKLTLRWWLLYRFSDFGAVSVEFANGRRLFVPLVQNAGQLVSVSSTPMRPRVPRPLPEPPMGVDEFNARMQEFARLLEEEDEAERERERVRAQTTNYPEDCA